MDAGVKNVFLIEESIAVALDASIKIEQSSGHIIIDVGNNRDCNYVFE
ncbi:rod shape-determining protein [Candidatus Ruthturnera calyptogenae]